MSDAIAVAVTVFFLAIQFAVIGVTIFGAWTMYTMHGVLLGLVALGVPIVGLVNGVLALLGSPL